MGYGKRHAESGITTILSAKAKSRLAGHPGCCPYGGVIREYILL